jgi:hypothetical protein
MTENKEMIIKKQESLFYKRASRNEVSWWFDVICKSTIEDVMEVRSPSSALNDPGIFAFAESATSYSRSSCSNSSAVANCSRQVV